MKYLVIYNTPSTESGTGWRTKASLREVDDPTSSSAPALGLAESDMVLAVIEFEAEAYELTEGNPIAHMWAAEAIVEVDED